MSFIEFIDAGFSESGKTKKWNVASKDGVILGTVSWWSFWRRYTFHPSLGVVLDPVCLRDIADFMSKQTSFHKEK